MKLRFILNPRSGVRRPGEDVAQTTREFIACHNLDATLVLTERPRHATELTRRAIDDGCDLIVAIGGDGTVNEIASALIGTSATLGIIPRGSGNGLVRHLGLPRTLETALSGLLTGRPRAIDTGLVNGQHTFLNVVGLGFDVEISQRFNRLTRRGLIGYARTVCGAFFSYRKTNYRVGVFPDTSLSPPPPGHARTARLHYGRRQFVPIRQRFPYCARRRR